MDATNHPGLYEFQFADARFAVANAKQLIITVTGAGNLLTADYEVDLGACNSIADSHLDRVDGIETGLTPREAHRLEAAAAAGKLSGATTTTVKIRNAVADSKDRITATVDADGNRTAIATDVS